jgi:hypothetical protein
MVVFHELHDNVMHYILLIPPRWLHAIISTISTISSSMNVKVMDIFML